MSSRRVSSLIWLLSFLYPKDVIGKSGDIKIELRFFNNSLLRKDGLYTPLAVIVATNLKNTNDKNIFKFIMSSRRVSSLIWLLSFLYKWLLTIDLDNFLMLFCSYIWSSYLYKNRYDWSYM